LSLKTSSGLPYHYAVRTNSNRREPHPGQNSTEFSLPDRFGEAVADRQATYLCVTGTLYPPICTFRSVPVTPWRHHQWSISKNFDLVWTWPCCSCPALFLHPRRNACGTDRARPLSQTAPSGLAYGPPDPHPHRIPSVVHLLLFQRSSPRPPRSEAEGGAAEREKGGRL
jgi:hypothetical protein